jgi:hypothetical protein
MTTHLEQMPDKSNYYAVLHGPVVLAAKTDGRPDEKLNFLADDSRMGHIAQGRCARWKRRRCSSATARDFTGRFKPVRASR